MIEEFFAEDDGTPYVLCELCRRRVDPGAPDVVEVAELMHADSVRGTEDIEGLHVFFRRAYYPSISMPFRLVAKGGDRRVA